MVNRGFVSPPYQAAAFKDMYVCPQLLEWCFSLRLLSMHMIIESSRQCIYWKCYAIDMKKMLCDAKTINLEIHAIQNVRSL